MAGRAGARRWAAANCMYGYEQSYVASLFRVYAHTSCHAINLKNSLWSLLLLLITHVCLLYESYKYKL